MNELDKQIYAELEQFEKEAEEEEQKAGNVAGSISQAELTNALRVCKNAVEEVFGPVLFHDKNGQELCRSAAMSVLLAVIQHVCPRQINYNVMENIDASGEEWEE